MPYRKALQAPENDVMDISLTPENVLIEQPDLMMGVYE
jgi:hypothetical protein